MLFFPAEKPRVTCRSSVCSIVSDVVLSSSVVFFPEGSPTLVLLAVSSVEDVGIAENTTSVTVSRLSVVPFVPRPLRFSEISPLWRSVVSRESSNSSVSDPEYDSSNVEPVPDSTKKSSSSSSFAFRKSKESMEIFQYRFAPPSSVQRNGNSQS